MPVTQQMPGDARDAEFPGSGAQNVFEKIVRSKRSRPTRVQKKPIRLAWPADSMPETV
jgi:hypothetical protein